LNELEEEKEQRPSYYPTEKTTKVPDQSYWQELKRKHGFISAHTDLYPEKASTFKPELAFLTQDNSPQYYHANIPNLSSLLYENDHQTVTEPELIKSDNEINFDLENQPPSMPYSKNPAILVARRNISSSSDILDYLSQLMSTAKKLENVNGGQLEGIDRDTTIRTFFKPDLLQPNSDPLPLLQGLEKLQQSLIFYSNPQNLPSGDFQESVNNNNNHDEDYDWLTAQDIFNAAEDTSANITHSPIVLIPYEDTQANPTVPEEIFKDPFTILNTITSKQNPTKLSTEDIAPANDRVPKALFTGNQNVS